MQQSVAVQAQVALSFIPTDSASALGKAMTESPLKTYTQYWYMWRLLQIESIHLSKLSAKSSQRDFSLLMSH